MTKYKVTICFPDGKEVIDAVYVEYNDNRVLCFKTEDGMIHETTLPWYYRQLETLKPSTEPRGTK